MSGPASRPGSRTVDSRPERVEQVDLPGGGKERTGDVECDRHVCAPACRGPTRSSPLRRRPWWAPGREQCDRQRRRRTASYARAPTPCPTGSPAGGYRLSSVAQRRLQRVTRVQCLLPPDRRLCPPGSLLEIPASLRADRPLRRAWRKRADDRDRLCERTLRRPASDPGPRSPAE
jgi:hypothetical protein